MTDAPSPAAVAPRPDDRELLLGAIQRRDPMEAKRLGERWVHRRGLASLEVFEQRDLAQAAGSEALDWFVALLERPALQPATVLAAVPSVGAAALGPEIRLDDLDRPATAPEDPLPSVEEAFAALAAEFAPSREELESIVRSGLDQVDDALLPPAPVNLSFAIAPAAIAPADIPPAAIAPAEAAIGDGDVLTQREAPAESVVPPSRPWLGRVRGLLRTCFDEAMGSLNAASPAPRPDLESQPEPEPEPEPGVAEPAALAPAEASSAAEIAGDSAGEPLAPWPAFHPTASILAALPDPPVAAPAPEAPARWLPRLGLGAPALRPAPSPSDLADLRAWLPDGADDLPRAC